jgi:glycosyltransferase involved in cell wall biosynthesis
VPVRIRPPARHRNGAAASGPGRGRRGIGLRLAFLSIGRHIHTERWIRWFAGRGHDCHLLTVQPGPCDDVTVHDIRAGGGPKSVRYACSLMRVRRILAGLQPDLLNTHFLTGYGYWGHFSGFHPNVLTVWGDDVYVTPFESRLKSWLARRALRSCDALTGDSVDILDRAVRLGADPRRSFRVLWGVDFARFRPANANSFRRQLGFAEDDIVYFSPRSFTQPYYNIDVVIAAAACVQREEPRARFLFAGYEGDPAPFHALAERAGIGPVMRFVGRLPHERFASALQACDVFISVPSVDATAVSLLEAMACGCAVVVTALPSALEWISDGASGLVVPPRDISALTAGLLRFAGDAELRRRCGAAALVTARKHAGFADNMAHVDRIFHRLVAGEGDWPQKVALTTLQPGGEVGAA